MNCFIIVPLIRSPYFSRDFLYKLKFCPLLILTQLIADLT